MIVLRKDFQSRFYSDERRAGEAACSALLWGSEEHAPMRRVYRKRLFIDFKRLFVVSLARRVMGDRGSLAGLFFLSKRLTHVAHGRRRCSQWI